MLKNCILNMNMIFLEISIFGIFIGIYCEKTYAIFYFQCLTVLQIVQEN